MSRTPFGLRYRALGVCLVTVATALALAACGSSSSSSSSATSAGTSTASAAASQSGGANVAAAQAIVTKLEQPVPFTVPSLGSRPPAGKTVVQITCTLPLCLSNVGSAVAKLGWKFHEIEFDVSKGPQAYATAFTQALQEKPNYILTVGIFPPTLVSQQMAQAAADHIPVVSIIGLSNNAAIKSCVNCAAYIAKMGATLADLAIAGGANGSGTVYTGDPTNIGTGQTWVGVQSEFTRLHAGAPHQLSLSLAHSEADNASAVVSYIQSHPGTKAVVTSTADLTVGLPSALSQAGLAGKVKYYVSGPQTPDLGFIQSGSEAPAVAIMNNAAWWNAVDQVAKLSVGKAASANPGGWIAIVTKGNASSILAKSYGPRPEPPNYEQQYLTAWGVG
jgi:ribose transport system substrate-binding protein